jgi:hypothetical protein
MNETRHQLVQDLRKVLSGYDSHELTFQNLANDLNLNIDVLINAFGNEAGLVEEILDYEQQNLENIFAGYDFGGLNAIDGLLGVSREISKKFVNIVPSITFDLRTLYPEVRQKFVEKRISFVNSKIKFNFPNP